MKRWIIMESLGLKLGIARQLLLGLLLVLALAVAGAWAVAPLAIPENGNHGGGVHAGAPAISGQAWDPEQEPPPLPATVYGNVTIVCQENGTLRGAPRGLGVYAVAPNGSILASTSTGNGTLNPSSYQLSVSGYSGRVYLFVGSVNVTYIDVSPGDIVRVDLVVNESEPPGPPQNLSVEPAYGPRPNISWAEPWDNLGVAQYRLVLSNSSGVLFNLTLNETSWSPPEDLGDGVYQVSVSAVDLSCNWGPPATLVSIVDTRPPALESAVPANESYLTVSDAWVNLTFSDITPQLHVNLSLDGVWVNASVESLGGGLWRVSYHATLADGGHVVDSIVWDDAGNTANVTLVFTVDTGPPQAGLVSGPIGRWTSQASGQVVLQVYDAVSGVDWDSILAEIDGSPTSYTVDPDAGTVTVSYSLGEGWHLLHVEVIDKAGNTAYYTGGFGIDTTPPSIEVASPTDGERLGSNYVCITATLTDNLSGIDWGTLSVYIEGYGEAEASYNESTGEVQACVNLNDGTYTATVSASDKAGNPASASVEFTVATGAPKVEVASPPAGGIVAGPAVGLNITVSDDSGLTNVTVLIDGGQVAYCDCEGNTSWTYIDTVQLSEGQHNLTVTAWNMLGRNRTFTMGFTVDNNPPQAILYSPPAEGVYVNSTSYCITGIATDTIGVNASAVLVLVNGEPVQASYNESTGEVRACVTLGAGNHTIAIQVSDMAGHTAVASSWLVVDLEPPTITVDSPADGGLYPSSFVNISLSASDDWSLGLVEVYLDGGLIYNTSGPGPVSYTSNASLSDGAHQLKVVALDAAGNMQTATITFTVDSTPPEVTIIQPANGSVLSTSIVSLVASLFDAVSGVDPSSVRVYVDGSEYTGFNYSSGLLTATLNLTPGSHEVVVEASDLAGHTAAATVVFTVDLEAPTVSIAPKSGSYLAGPIVEVGVNVSDDAGLAEVSVYLDGELLASCSCGNQSYTHTWSLNLSDGQHNLTVTASDLRGSTARATTIFYTDSQPPLVHVESPLNGSYLGTTPVCIEATITDNIALNATTIIVALDGEPVEFDYNPLTGSLEACINASEGTHSATIQASDMAGRTAAATVEFTVDLTPPAILGITPEPGSILPSGEANLTITVDDNIGLANATITWPGGSAFIPLNGSLNASVTLAVQLPEGADEVTVVVYDLAGHTASAEADYLVDETPPIISIETPTNASIEPTGSISLVASLFDAVSGVDPSSVRVYVDGSEYTGFNYSSGLLTATLNLGAGEHTVTVQASDLAGHTVEATVEFTVDPYPPQVYLLGGIVTNTSQVALEVSAFENVTWLVEALVYVDGALCCSYNLTGNASWSTLLNLTLPEGQHTVYLVVYDAAGHAAEAESMVTVDLTPPQLLGVSPPNGTISRPGELPGVTLVVSESTTNLSSVTAILNGASVGVNVTSVGGGAYQLYVAISEDLVEPGANTLLVKVEDAAGNTLEVRLVFYVDYYQPGIDIVEPSENVPGAYVSNTTNITLVARVYDNDTWISGVSLYVDGMPSGFNYTNGTLTAALQLGEGPHLIVISATDAAGRTSTASLQVIVDLTPPSITLASPPNGTIAASPSVNVTFTIIDASGYLSEVWASVDGEQANVTLQSVGQGVFEAIVEVDASTGGSYHVSLYVLDAAGHGSLAHMMFYADWEPPVIEANSQYILPPGIDTLNITVWDDAIEALQELGIVPLVSGPVEIVEWTPNGTLILEAASLEQATPYQVSIQLTDLQGRTAVAVFYLVNGTPASFNTTLEPGVELLSPPIGVVPQVLQGDFQASCPNATVYEVSPDWSLTPHIAEPWAPALLVDARNATGQCTLSYTGYTLPVNASFIARWSQDGSRAVIVPLEDGLDPGDVVSDGILYTIDPETGRWRVAAASWAGTLGSLDSLEKGRAYLAARLPKAPGRLSTPQQKPVGSLEGMVGDEGTGQRGAGAGAAIATVGLAAAALATGRARKHQALATLLLALLVASMLGLPVIGQEAVVTVTPPDSLEVEPGSLISLSFEASYSDSYQSLVLLDLRIPEGFSFEGVNITMEGTPQEPQVSVSGNNVSILVEDLQPPNGRLEVKVYLTAPEGEGNYTLAWRFTIQAMSQLSPQPPVVEQGQTGLEVSAPATATVPPQTSTTTTTPGGANTTTSQTSPQPTATTPSVTQSTTTQPASTGTSTNTGATVSPHTSTSPGSTATAPATTPSTTQKQSRPLPLAAAIAAIIIVAAIAFFALRRR